MLTMADETSLKSREEILWKILHKIEEWQRSFEAKFEKISDDSDGKTEAIGSSSDNEADDRTLFIKIHAENYLISSEVLNRVFSGIGGLERIEKLDQGSQFHSRIRFQSHDSAIRAFNCYNGRYICDGCCQMELFFGSRNNSRSKNTEASIADTREVQEINKVVQKLEQAHPDNQRDIQDERDLLVKIHLQYYVISCEVLSLAFSGIGGIESIERSDDASLFHWRIRFRSPDLALKAFENYNGRCIYDDCCRLELLLGGRSKDKTSDTGTLIEDGSQVEEFKALESFNDLKELDSELVTNQDTGNCSKPMGYPFQEMDCITGQLGENSEQLVDELKNFHEESEASKSEINSSDEVIYDSCYSLVSDFDVWKIAGSVDDSVEFSLSDAELISIENLGTSEHSAAHEMFDEMPYRTFKSTGDSVQVSNAQLLLGNCIFDPGIAEDLHYISDCFSKQVVEQANLKLEDYGLNLCIESHLNGSKLIPSYEYDPWIVDPTVRDVISVFDPGIVCYDRVNKLLCEFDLSDRSRLHVHNGGMETLAISIFDPGIYKAERVRRFVVHKFSDRLHEFGDFDPGGNCLHQFGLTIMDDARQLSHYLLLEEGRSEGLLLIRSIWVIACSLLFQRLVFDTGRVFAWFATGLLGFLFPNRFLLLLLSDESLLSHQQHVLQQLLREFTDVEQNDLLWLIFLSWLRT